MVLFGLVEELWCDGYGCFVVIFIGVVGVGYVVYFVLFLFLYDGYIFIFIELLLGYYCVKFLEIYLYY